MQGRLASEACKHEIRKLNVTESRPKNVKVEVKAPRQIEQVLVADTPTGDPLAAGSI